MPKRNRFDYIDNTVHETTDLDRAQKDWYDKVKKSAFGNQDIGRAMFGPKPGDWIPKNLKNNDNKIDMGKGQEERFTPREENPPLADDGWNAGLFHDKTGFGDGGGVSATQSLASPDSGGSSIPQNNFIPPATQDDWANKWDGIQTEENFRIAREDGSNPAPNPPDTTVNLDRKGTMNNLFSSSLT
tara:strand:+ start:84 stop:641 length:558 start_codon:yes stop_codon:yes gene_type:complete